LRPDAREATFLRSKLLCDVHNRLGIPSVSANYATLYINDEYMGFYILMDSIKLSWIDFVYGDKDSTSLYRCKDVNNDLSVKMSSTGCINDNEEVTDNSEWIEFLTALDSAQSAEDIENIFDIDLFLTEIAIEYISGSWDHYLIYGHNFYLYKPKDDKWKFIVYDYDGDFGQDIDMGINGMSFDFTAPRNPSTDYPTYSFEEWTKSRHLVDILILNNSTRFDNILTNLVSEIFNPATLFPYIDELKEFVRPYVELDKIPDENGKYPGRLNEKSGDYSLAEWDANCEFTTVRSSQGSRGYGLKYWILAKYRYICKAYNMECDQTYLDENYEYTIDKEVEADDNDVAQPTNIEVVQSEITETDEPTTILADQTTTIEVAQPTTIVVPQPTTIPNKYNCWVEQFGYPCCSSRNKIVYAHDGEGDWGYDFSKMEWCGITPYTEHINDEECWSEVLGYPCCKSCTVYDTDSDGQWGYEDEHWCGIQSYCQN
ncbi:putative cellulase, partial [Neocallimastix californiae]